MSGRMYMYIYFLHNISDSYEIPPTKYMYIIASREDSVMYIPTLMSNINSKFYAYMWYLYLYKCLVALDFLFSDISRTLTSSRVC